MVGDMIFKVTHDDSLHHVVPEVSMISVVFAEFTVDCVKGYKQLTIYLRNKPEDGGRFCSLRILLLIVMILMTRICKST
jgi:hypothetical protein